MMQHLNVPAAVILTAFVAFGLRALASLSWPGRPGSGRCSCGPSSPSAGSVSPPCMRCSALTSFAGRRSCRSALGRSNRNLDTKGWCSPRGRRVAAGQTSTISWAHGTA